MATLGMWATAFGLGGSMASPGKPAMVLGDGDARPSFRRFWTSRAATVKAAAGFAVHGAALAGRAFAGPRATNT